MPKTNFVINNKLMLDAESLIFAEIASPGAMGAAGIVSIFVLESGKMKHYTFDSANPAENKSYDNCDEMFRIGTKNGLLDYVYAGFGNHAFKKHGIRFERDDDNAILIYVDGRKRHKIKPSCMGVYSHIVKEFAESPVDLERVREIVEYESEKLDDAETAFLKVYAEQCSRLEGGSPWFNITVTDYNDAISYIKFRRGENVEDYRPDEYAPFGIEAIQKYRLKYLVETLGWNRVHRFMKRFIRGAKKDLFKQLDEILGEKQKISDKFMKIRSGKYGEQKIERFADLFEYPTIINLDEESRKELNQEIIETANLNVDADDISYYLMNYFWHLFEWGFDEIEPVAWYIIDNCPTDDVDNTGTDKLFWVASHIINTYWKRLSGKENDEFEEKVLKHFAGRVGGLWPIVHYGEFTMNNEASQFILEESIGYIVSVEEEKWSKLPGLSEYLYSNKALSSNHEAIRDVAEKIQEKTS